MSFVWLFGMLGSLILQVISEIMWWVALEDFRKVYDTFSHNVLMRLMKKRERERRRIYCRFKDCNYSLRLYY